MCFKFNFPKKSPLSLVKYNHIVDLTHPGSCRAAVCSSPKSTGQVVSQQALPVLWVMEQ